MWQIPETGRKSKGKPLVNLLEGLQPDERIATTLRVSTFDDPSSIFMATKKGTVKKTELKEFSHPRRKGIWAIKIDEDDEVIATRLVGENQQVMLFTAGGMAVRFDQTDVRPMGRVARGVRGVKLRDNKDAVVGCEIVNGDESVLIVCENGFGKRTTVSDFRQTKRGGVGVKSIVTSERNGLVLGAICVTDEDNILMMSGGGQTVRINMTEVRVMGRNTQGVKLANIRDDDHLVAMQKIESESESESESEGEVEGDEQESE